MSVQLGISFAILRLLRRNLGACNENSRSPVSPLRDITQGGTLSPLYITIMRHYFPGSSTVITDDYCPGGHLPSINKAEERWRRVATLTPTARLDVEESRFRPEPQPPRRVAVPLVQAPREGTRAGDAEGRSRKEQARERERERSLIVRDRQPRSHNQYLG